MSQNIYEIKQDENSIYLKFIYLPEVVDELKKLIPSQFRRFDKETNTWIIDKSRINEVNYIVDKYFRDLTWKTYLIVTYDCSPSIYGIQMIYYSRDYASPNKSPIFNVITFKRYGPHGSRKYPQFNAVILTEILKSPNVEIKSSTLQGELKVFEVPDNVKLIVKEFLERLEITEDRFNTVVQKLEEFLNQVIQQKQTESKTIKFEEEKIVIKGFLIVHDLPSEGRLDTHLKEIFQNVKIGNKQIKLVTGWFYNRLKSLRRKFYNILNQYTVYAGFGYILPTYKINEFIREIEGLKKEYEDYEKKLKEFLLEGRLPEGLDERAKVDIAFTELVKNYLKQHGVDVEAKIKSISIVDGFKVRLIPFSLSYEFIQDFIDEKVRNEVMQHVEKVKHELIENVKREIEEKAKVILDKLMKYVEAETYAQYIINKLKQELDEVKKLANEFGIKTKTIDYLDDILSVETKEEFIKKIHEFKTSMSTGRLKALLSEIS